MIVLIQLHHAKGAAEMENMPVVFFITAAAAVVDVRDNSMVYTAKSLEQPWEKTVAKLVIINAKQRYAKVSGKFF